MIKNELVVGLCQTDAVGHLGEVTLGRTQFGWELRGTRYQGSDNPKGDTWEPDVHDLRVDDYCAARHMFWLAAYGEYPRKKPAWIRRFQEAMVNYTFLGNEYKTALVGNRSSTPQSGVMELERRYGQLMDMAWEKVCEAYFQALDVPQLRIDGLLSALLDPKARYVNDHAAEEGKLKIADRIRSLFVDNSISKGGNHDC